MLWPMVGGATDKLFLRLRTERERQDLTVQWVADRVAVTKQSLSEWETGKSRPGTAAVRKWVKALGLPETEADEWLDWRVEEEVAEVLTKLRGPRALPPEDVDAIRRSVQSQGVYLAQIIAWNDAHKATFTEFFIACHGK